MLNDQHDFMAMENELRHSLRRGYRQVRAAQTQGVYLKGAECALELLGDPHLLVLTYPGIALRLRIPVVCVAGWTLESGSDAVQAMLGAFHPDDVLTGYRRRYTADRDRSGIHNALVEQLQKLITGFPDKRVLLDWMWAPRPHEDNHDEIRSENWFAYHQAQHSPNSIFSGVQAPLPSQVRSVDGVVRLSFPLGSQDQTDKPAEMVTLVLGLAFEVIANADHHAPTEITSRIANAVRGLATVLMREIPQLYSVIRDRKPHTPKLVRAPEWASQRERDALHSALDDLHRKVIALAGRVGLEGWERPENGFNFVLAFRELDDSDSYHAKLRYHLSTYNLHAIEAAGVDLDQWRLGWEAGLANCKPALAEVFARSGSSQDVPSERRLRDYLERCSDDIRRLFAEGRELNDVRRELAATIEAERYYMRLTPGYWVMDLCHPEVIREWLKDPRAMDFDRYPERLLVWEASALPNEIYYSPIVDGAVPIGVCGINNDLIEKNECPAYELQELIDESAPRFRRILTNNELEALGHDIRSMREMLGHDVGDGITLWHAVLRRFRRLAYFYLPGPHDYHTKLVRDKDVNRLLRGAAWVKQGSGWWERDGLSETDVNAVYTAAQAMPEGSAVPLDFVRRYLDQCTSCRNQFGELQAMGEAFLHRVTIRDAEGLSLLVLVPCARHNDLAHELIHRFATTCEIALREYSDEVRARSKLPPKPGDRSSGPFDVFLSYNSRDRELVEQIADGLYRRQVTPWFDRWAVKPGDAWLRKIQDQIETIPCAVVFIGDEKTGPWQQPEIENLLDAMNNRGGKVIPVLISKEAGIHQLPALLRRLHALNYHESMDPLSELVDAIRASGSNGDSA